MESHNNFAKDDGQSGTLLSSTKVSQELCGAIVTNGKVGLEGIVNKESLKLVLVGI